MKTNILKSAAALFAAAAVLSGCLPSKLGNTPSLTIQAAQENFDDNGEATVSLVLSEAASDDVAVNLSASGDLAAAVSFDKAVVISAGNKFLDVRVALTDKTKSGGVTIAIDAVNGATIGKAKSVTLVATKAAVPTVSISSYDDVFNENNAATITLALNPAASADVTVTLAVAAKESEEFAVIPADAVTLDAQVKIPAGQKSATATVSVNPELLPTGDSYLYIDVTAVSEGAEIGKNIEAVICFTKPIVANLRSDWTISYKGTNDEGKDVIGVAGVGETGTYYLYYFTPGVIAENFKDMSEFLNYVETNYVAPYLGTEDADQVFAGDDDILLSRLPLGGYEFYIIGCDSRGHLTGDYATVNVNIEPSAELLEAYEAWLGEWQIGTNVFTVNEVEKASGTYAITVTPSATTYRIDAKIGWNKELQFYVTEPACEAGGVGFYGYYPSEEQGYISIYSGTSAIGEALLDETGEAGTIQSTNDGFFDGMALFTFEDKSITGWGEIDIDFSKISTFKRPVKEASANYSRWIGSWKVGETDTVVSFGAYLLDEALTFGSLNSASGWDVTVPFDTVSGNLKYEFNYFFPITYQEVQYGVYSSGLTNAGYVATGNEDRLIANIIYNEDGTATIEAVKYQTKDADGNDIEDYAVSIGLLGYNQTEGWLGITPKYIALPATLTKVEEATEPTEPAGAPALKNVVRFEKIDAVSSREIKPLHRQISQKRVSGIDSLR